MTKPQSLPVEEARKKFADILDGSQFQSTHTEVTRRGKSAGYVVPPEWYAEAVDALAERQSRRTTTRTQVVRPVPGAPEDDRPALTDDEAHDLVQLARMRGTDDQRQRLHRTSVTAESLGRDPDLDVIEAAFEMGLLTNDDLPRPGADATEES